jgi:hypothetical protein
MRTTVSETPKNKESNMWDKMRLAFDKDARRAALEATYEPGTAVNAHGALYRFHPAVNDITRAEVESWAYPFGGYLARGCQAVYIHHNGAVRVVGRTDRC